MWFLYTTLTCLLFVGSCCCNGNISDKILTNRSPHCRDYVGNYCAWIENKNTTDTHNKLLKANLKIEYLKDICICTTDCLPNHDVNDGPTAFPNDIAEVDRVLRFTSTPTFASAPVGLSLDYFNGILLNGALIDVLSDGCCSTLPDLIRCTDITDPYRLDPISSLAGFYPDSHNSHSQPDHTYHYRGDPHALYDDSGTIISPVIGFATDGFPIYGPYIEDAGTIRPVESSYQMKTDEYPVGSCPESEGETTPEGKNISDYVYIPGTGDLDSCNGMWVGNEYAYFLTKEYPYFMSCFMGTPDISFHKS